MTWAAPAPEGPAQMAYAPANDTQPALRAQPSSGQAQAASMLRLAERWI